MSGACGRCLLLACFAVSITAGCSKETVARTQVMVVVDAEPGVRAETSGLQIVVKGGTDETALTESYNHTIPDGSAEDLVWPWKIAVVPAQGDPERVFEVEVTALDAGGGGIARVRAISGFLPNKTLMLTLKFDDACLGKLDDCGATQTCSAGECEDAHVDVGTLPPYGDGQDTPDDFDNDGGVSLDIDASAEPVEDGGGGGSAGSDAAVEPRIDGGTDGSTVYTDADTNDGSTDVAIEFPTAPNIDTSALDLDSAPTAEVTCGDLAIDTTGPSLIGWCGDSPTTVVQSQDGGPEVVVLAFKSLVLPAGKTVRAVGSRPVALVIAGDATIDGIIDASADGTTPGAGGNVSCTVGTPDDGRGGGGGFGTRGGGYLDNAGDPAGAGQEEGTTDLVPLRGGCAGGLQEEGCFGLSSSSLAGAGGGAVELVVGGRLSGAGEIRANGGIASDGSLTTKAGSGGGSGGAILVSAGVFDDTLRLSVHGGNGGPGAAFGGQPGVTDPSDVGVADVGSTSCNAPGAGGGYGRIVVLP